jgi:glycosyltransferase involved in cell wall biosynthesis
VQVVSFKRQYPAWLYPGETDRDPSADPLRTPAEFLLDPLYPWTWLAAVRSMRAFQPDLVVVQWWTTFWGPPFASLAWLLKRRKTPVAYLIHNVLPHEQRPWDRPLAWLALSQGDAFIVQTPREQERLQALLPDARTLACPLPAFDIAARPDLTPTQARLQLGLNPQDYWMLFFGFVRPYKGLHVLLQAMSRLKAAGRRPCLAIVGEFWHDRADYQAEIEQLQLESQVRIEDRYIPDEEIGPWFAAADCLVAPYTAGTQSGAVGVALVYGLPMIASQQVVEGIAPQHRSIVARAVPPGDAAALAEAIAAVMDAPHPGPPQPIPAADGWQALVRTLETIAPGAAA